MRLKVELGGIRKGVAVLRVFLRKRVLKLEGFADV